MKTVIVTHLKRQATKVLAELAADHDPVLITEHGKPAAYLVDVSTYEQQQARMQVLEGIARGERAVEQGRSVDHADAKQRMARWLED